ncbi:MAG: hypothetical protein A2Y41_02220 [Spirochaetes bacterium GWB1_36_13]|nr:MAG: hypothetical protein A2Y41_02220 [Spirochaetes bacterium GWB1_36_13]
MLKINFSSLKEIEREENADILIVKTPEGEMGILNGHELMTAELLAGPHRYKQGNIFFYFYLSKGMLEIKKESIEIYAMRYFFADSEVENWREKLTYHLDIKKDFDYDVLKKNMIKELTEKMWHGGKRF